MLIRFYTQCLLLILVLSSFVSAARRNSKKRRDRWACDRSNRSLNSTSSCKQCGFRNPKARLRNTCPMDGYTFKTEEDCLMRGGCSSIAWQCVGAPEDRKCTYCNQTSGAKRPCVESIEVFKTEVDCEVNSGSKCGIQCQEPDEQLFPCKFKEPRCAKPTEDKNRPFGCEPGCNCKPGYFRFFKKCVKPEKCPIPNKNCFKEVLEKYKQNFDAIQGEKWPHTYMQPFDVPMCDRKGNYEEVQCSQKLKKCYCVDTKNGEPRPEHDRTTEGSAVNCDSKPARNPSKLANSSSTKPQLSKFSFTSSHEPLYPNEFKNIDFTQNLSQKTKNSRNRMKDRKNGRKPRRNKRTRRNKNFRN